MKYLLLPLIFCAGCGNMATQESGTVGNISEAQNTVNAQPYEQLDRSVRQYEAIHGKAEIQPYMLAPQTLERRLTPMESFQLQRQMRQFYLKQNKPYPADMDGKIFRQEFAK